MFYNAIVLYIRLKCTTELHFLLCWTIHSPFFEVAVVERALVAVLETVAAAHLATELPTISDAITTSWTPKN